MLGSNFSYVVELIVKNVMMIRVRPFTRMEGSGSDPDSHRAASTSGSSRRFGMLAASNIIQAPLSALLEYSGLLRGRQSHQESEALISARLPSGFRDHLRSHIEESSGATNDGEVSIRIIGAGEPEHGRDGAGLVVGQARDVSGQNAVSLQSVSGLASVTLGSELSQGESANERGAREGIPESINAGADGDASEAAGGNSRDSSYQRYDIQQAARGIEQILPFSFLLLVVFIRQHLQGTCLDFIHDLKLLWVTKHLFTSNFKLSLMWLDYGQS